MSPSETAAYPPDHHVLRDLAPRIERDGDEVRLLQKIVPSLLDSGGGLRAGVAAMAVDILAGDVALRAVHPDWIATSGLSLQIDRQPGAGTLALHPRLLREGRTTALVEIALQHVESGAAIGLATTSFSRLPSRTGFQRQADWLTQPTPVVTFGADAPGFAAPVLETIGVRAEDDAASVWIERVDPYVVNSLGALQGGVVALLIDAAAERHATRAFGGPARIHHLELHYLRLGKVGPIRATARPIASLRGDARLLRVELHDAGREDALLTVASVVIDRAA